MPVVIPAAAGSTSALQTVPTQNVFDYLYDSQSNPLKNKRVVITLGVENANSITPQVSLSNLVIQTTTDNNGFWSVNLIPNANINPANTVYTVQVEQGLPDYQISIPSTGGPFQSTSPAVLVNTPGVLAPATTGITGNLTVTGNETVTGTLAVSGATTLAGTTTGALTTAAASIGGDLTIQSAFRLLFGAAVAKIVGGATSTSIRDSTDAFDNLLVSGAGLATARAGLTATAGPLSLGAGAASLGNVVASRYIGSWSTFGPPTGLTASVADFGFDGAGVAWVCSVAGTPGTWVGASPSGRFHAEIYQSANSTISTATLTSPTFDTVEGDPNGNIANIGTTNVRYNVPVPGRFRVSTQCEWSSFPTGQYSTVSVAKNGVETKRLSDLNFTSGSVNRGQGGSVVIRCAASDFLQVAVNQQSGSNQTLLGGQAVTYAEFEYVGPL